MAWVRVNRDSCMAVLDSGAQINTVTPGFVENHSLDVRPLSDLIDRGVICAGLGNTLTWPIGYIIIWVQVDEVQGYDKDQIALVVPDLSNFEAWVPTILGTLTIGCIMNVIKENKIDTLVTPLVNAHVAYLLAVRWVTAMLEDDKVTTRVLDSTEYDEVVTTKGSEMIEAFSSKIIYAQMKTVFTNVRLNVMTHALHTGEGPLSPSLMIQNSYIKMHNGSKNVAVVVRNSMAYPQTLKKKIPVVRVVAASLVPELQVWPGTIDALDEAQGIQTQKLIMEQRQEKLFDKLDLSSLWSWLPELADSACLLPAEYHISSLEPCELSCTHLT